MFERKLIAPTVNLNGTSASDLMAAHMAAVDAIRAAEDAVRKCMPHGRDYPGTDLLNAKWSDARHAFRERLVALDQIGTDLYAVACHVHSQTSG